MLNKVIEILSHHTEVKTENINSESNLVKDLGLSSFDVVNAVVEFEDEFDIEIEDEDIKSLRTVGDITNYIRSVRNE